MRISESCAAGLYDKQKNKTDDEEYLSKIALARKYAQERQRYEYLPDKVILHSTHGIRTITKENGHYHCTCDYYQKNGTCSHIMSLFIS